MKKIAFVLVAFAAISLLRPAGYAIAQQASAGSDVAVDTIQVVRQDRILSRQWSGVVEAERDSTLAAQIQGRVQRIQVKAGQTVVKGQILADIDARDSAAALAQVRAGLARANASMVAAKSLFERRKRLYDQGFISQAAHDEAATGLSAAKAAVAQARASIARQKVAQTFTTISAPYDGLIADVLIDEGEVAQPGRALIVMHAPDRLRVSTRIPTAFAASIKQGATARIEGENSIGEPGWSELLAISILPAADPLSATVEMRLSIPSKSVDQYRPGQFVRMVTKSVDGQALYIPQSALLVRGELNAVYVVREQRFVLRAVRPGSSNAQSIEVLAGLRDGERIAVDPVRAGVTGARPGQEK